MEKTYLTFSGGRHHGGSHHKYIAPKDLVQASIDVMNEEDDDDDTSKYCRKSVSLEFAKHMITTAKGFPMDVTKDDDDDEKDEALNRNNKRQRLTYQEFVDFFSPPDP